MFALANRANQREIKEVSAVSNACKPKKSDTSTPVLAFFSNLKLPGYQTYKLYTLKIYRRFAQKGYTEQSLNTKASCCLRDIKEPQTYQQPNSPS